MKSAPRSPRRPASGVAADRKNRCAATIDYPKSSAALRWKTAPLCLLAMVVCVIPLRAQKTRYTPNFGAAGNPPLTIVRDANTGAGAITHEERCFPWNLKTMRSSTVNVSNLKVPSNARDEYEKACEASNKNRFREAEQHAQSATEKFKDYSAAWVLLGVIFEKQHKSQEARDACSHAAKVDAKYLPAYLCVAEVSVRDRDWEQVLSSADLALGLQSEGDPYAYYYRAIAYMHLNDTIEAKKSALRAAEIDFNHDEPSVLLLLAEISEREGDNANAIIQLQQFLKHPNGRQQEDAARQLLAKLESQQSSK